MKQSTISAAILLTSISTPALAVNYLCKPESVGSNEQIKLFINDKSDRPTLSSLIWYNQKTSKRLFDTGEDFYLSPASPISPKSADEMVFQIRAQNRKSSLVMTVHTAENDFETGDAFKATLTIKNKRGANFKCRAYTIK